MAKNKKSTNLIVITIFIVLAIGVIVASTTDFFSVVYTNPVGNYPEGILDYPTAANSKIFSPIYGRVLCTNTGLPMFIYEQGSFVETSNTAFSGMSLFDYEGSNYHWVYCPAEYGENCQIEITNFKCDYPNVEGIEKIYQVGLNSETQSFNNQLIAIPPGKNEYIEIGCALADTGWAGISYDYSIKPTTSTAEYTVRTRQMKIELQDPNGRTKFGFLEGTEGCRLSSIDSNVLKDIQIQGQSEIKGISRLELGQDYNIVLGWVEESGANINPLGKFQNYDYVSCKPYTGIYSLKMVATEGGKSYFVQDDLLTSYSEANSMCCGDDQCSGGYVCEDYFCVEEPKICEFGECNPNFFDERQECVENYNSGNMNFYLVTTKCGSDGCIQKTSKEVECCSEYCKNAYGPDYYCDYSAGCIYIETLDPCPEGFCCLEGFSHEPKACPSDMTCCIGQNDGGNGLDLGICKPACSPTFDEICFDGKDNDGDGIIDESDCIIDCGATPDAEACREGEGGISIFLVVFSIIGSALGVILGLKWTNEIEKTWIKVIITIGVAVGFFFLFYFIGFALLWVWNGIVQLFTFSF